MRAALLALFVVALGVSVSAQSQTWVTLAKDIETIIIGISFINETDGWVPGDQNGVGALFLRTTDGGLSWRPCSHEGIVTLPMGIAMQKAADGSVGGVVSGIGIGRNFTSMEYTTNGQVFQAPSPNPNFVGASQDAKAVGGVDHWFALAGEFTTMQAKNFNGLALSKDGGKTWADIDVGFSSPLSRYGSYPTPTTFFISAGQWPSLMAWDQDPDAKVLSQYVRIHKTKGLQFRRMMPEMMASSSRRLLQTYPYEATIARTTDGGATWTTVYNDTGNFYLNDIFCWDAQKCWAVGEAESDSPAPGVRIIATTNGGNTWTQQLYVNDATYSLMDIAFVSATEGWAVGGILAHSITGAFWHTTDGGATWNLETKLNDEYATAVSFVHTTTVPSGYLGWASALTIEGQSSILAYK